MSKLRKGATISIALASSVALLAGCGSTNNTSDASNASKSATPVNGGSLTIAQNDKFNPKFIPMMDGSEYTIDISNFAFDSLLAVNKNMMFEPALAKSWSWSSDKKSLTIELQSNAKWSDGQPITSDDVLFTMDYLASQAYNTTLGGEYEYVVDPVLGSNEIVTGKKTSFAQTGGFKKINDKTFKLTFKQVDAAVLWSDIATLQPIPKHILSKIPVSTWMTASYDKMPTVVSGPYTFVKVSGQDSVIMKENPLYWRGRPHIDNVTWKTVNANVEPGELASGDVDYIMTGLKPDDVSKLKEMQNVTVVTSPAMSFSYLGLKLNQPEFKDVRVRQAIMYAIDRNAIIKGVQKGLAQTINGPVPNVSWAAATQKDGMNNYDFNPAKANQLLDQAGWKKGADGLRIDPSTGKTASLNLDYTADPTVQRKAIAVQQDLAKVGVKVMLTTLDFNALDQKVLNDDKSLNMWLMGWGLSPDPDPRGIWGSNNAMNLVRWKDKKEDQLIARTYSAAAFNQATRKKAIIDFQVYVNQQLPYVFLYQEDNIFAYNNRMHVPDKDNTALGLINPQDWWVQ